MADVTIKQHDNFPYLQATLKSNGAPIDLTTAVSIKFIAKATGGTITGTCTIVGSPTAGVVQYQWGAGDTTLVTDYQVEFEITWPTSKVQTVPNDSYKSLSVMADLG